MFCFDEHELSVTLKLNCINEMPHSDTENTSKREPGMDIIQSPKRDLLSMSYMPSPRPSTEDEE